MKKPEIASVVETKPVEKVGENQAEATDEQKNLETQQKASDPASVETNQEQTAKETPSLVNEKIDEKANTKLDKKLSKDGYQIVKARIIKTFECTFRYRAGLCFGKDWDEYTVSDSELAMIQSDPFLEVAEQEA